MRPATRAIVSFVAVLVTAGLFVPPASAKQQRIAVYAAADRGMGGDVVLRYAESDAARVAAAFRELGGVATDYLLLGADAARIQDTLVEVRAKIDQAHRGGDSVLLFFFYSGHADQDFLRARGSSLTWAKLKDLVKQTGADVSVTMIDACSSGGATLAKGASLGPPFVMAVEGSAALAGTVWISSSRGSEASYESDELGGSFFSHYLVSAMRGAADANEDGRVTLSEIYQFAYAHTVHETSQRLRTIQHPTVEIDLKGEDEIVVTELQLSEASLVLPRNMAGTFFLARRFGTRASVVQVEKRPGTLVRMGVGEGAYLFYRRDPDRIWIAGIELRHGRELVVDPSSLRPRSYDEVVGKGGIVQVASWRGHLWGAARGELLDGVPWFPFVRAGVVRRDMWLAFGADVGASRFSFAAVDTNVRTYAVEARLRAEAFLDRRWAALFAGAGLAILYLDQQPQNASAVRSFSPGLALGAGVERPLVGAWQLRLDVGTTLWVVQAIGGGSTLRFTPEVSAGVGFRFR